MSDRSKKQNFISFLGFKWHHHLVEEKIRATRDSCVHLRSVGTNPTGTLKTFDFLAAPLNFYFSSWDRWHFIMSFTCYLFIERCMKIFNLPTTACPFSVCLEMVPNRPPLIKTQHSTTQLKGYQQWCEVPHWVRVFHGEDFNESAVITVGCSQKEDMRLWEIWHKVHWRCRRYLVRLLMISEAVQQYSCARSQS